MLSVKCPVSESLPRTVSLFVKHRNTSPPRPPEPGNQGTSPGDTCKKQGTRYKNKGTRNMKDLPSRIYRCSGIQKRESVKIAPTL